MTQPVISGLEGLADVAGPSGRRKREPFRRAVQCSRCGHWLVDRESVRRHLGPRCAQKVAAQQEGAA